MNVVTILVHDDGLDAIWEELRDIKETEKPTHCQRVAYAVLNEAKKLGHINLKEKDNA